MRVSHCRALALLLAAALLAAACSSDEAADPAASIDTIEGTDVGSTDSTEATAVGSTDTSEATEAIDLVGTEVVITGPERSEVEVSAIQAAMDVFADETGMTISYTGSSDWESEINEQVGAGTPPDISIFPRPAKLADFASDRILVALPADVASIVDSNWGEAWTEGGSVDGEQFGVPVKADIKSLVWYKPAVFAEKGYDVPATFDAFVELANTMISNGDTPLCVGIGDGTATGWPYTDWVEDMMLRFEPVEVYDQWVSHEIPFDDERVVDQMQAVLDFWNTDDMVLAPGGTIASTAFQANAEPLAEGECLMHRQASFFSDHFPTGTVFGPDGIDVFYFPSNEGVPVLGTNTMAASFRDAPEVWAVLTYMASPEYATNRQTAQREMNGGDLSGFLTAIDGLDLSMWNPLEASMIRALTAAEVVRYDASDLMPPVIRAGSFWSEATAAVNGEQDAQQAAEKIEASWPS